MENPQTEYPHYNKNSVNPSTCIVMCAVFFLLGFLACHKLYTFKDFSVDRFPHSNVE